ncbi:MAG TPA: hypothetical protein VMV54_06400 [Acidocella sp.]|nr:hypothetical protein [Acidocella sp.]
MMRIFYAVALLAAGPAVAAPVFLPTRDVNVTYEVASPGRATQDYQLNYDAADKLARVESPAQQGMYVLANLPTGQAQVVVPALHAIVQAPDFSSLTQQIMSADGAQFTPLGHGNYAGMGCEKYLVLNAQGSGTACITHDGVVLHFAGKDAQGSAVVTALSVNFAAQPVGEFAPPDGFSNITLPPGALAALLQQ